MPAVPPDGELQSFMPGISRFIHRPYWLVVPIQIVGPFEACPMGKRSPRLRPLSIHFGEPIERSDFIDCGSGDAEDARASDGLCQELSWLVAAGVDARESRDSPRPA